MEIEVERNLLLKHPFTMLVAGATSSGKTVFIKNLLNSIDELMIPERPLPLKVVWAYGIFQENYKVSLPNPNVLIEYVEGLPDENKKCDIMVIDDLMSTLSDSKSLSNLFTRGSHHKNMSVIFIVQNFFNQGKEMRTVSLNSHYIVLMKNRRDLNQISRLGSQLYPKKKLGFFLDAYKKAMDQQDYGYLLIDLTQTTQEEFRLRTNILPHQYPIVIFFPKNV